MSSSDSSFASSSAASSAPPATAAEPDAAAAGPEETLKLNNIEDKSLPSKAFAKMEPQMESISIFAPSVNFNKFSEETSNSESAKMIAAYANAVSVDMFDGCGIITL